MIGSQMSCQPQGKTNLNILGIHGIRLPSGKLSSNVLRFRRKYSLGVQDNRGCGLARKEHTIYLKAVNSTDRVSAYYFVQLQYDKLLCCDAYVH